MILLVSWAPIGLRKLPMSLAILCVALGIVVFSTGVLSFNPDPRTWDTITERLAELVVIVSLMGAGLKLDRPIGWRRWGSTWRLLAVAMPLTIAATAWLGVSGLGFSLAMALLLGAAIAPTDPVQASDVQVGPPRSGDIAMIGSPHRLRERALLAFLGIRGIGSAYYVAYGLNHGNFGDSERLWAAVGFIIAASIVIHGISASPLLLRRARKRRGEQAQAE